MEVVKGWNAAMTAMDKSGRDYNVYVNKTRLVELFVFLLCNPVKIAVETETLQILSTLRKNTRK